MLESNRELCIEIINDIPEDQLSHVAVFLKSIKLVSDELLSETKSAKLTEIYKEISDSTSSEANEEISPKLIDDLDNLAEKVGIKLK